MEKGIKGKAELTVAEGQTAAAMGSGQLPVLATPAMVALMERAAWESVSGFLEEGQGTVGTRMEVRHLSPTPVGETVIATSELVEIDRRRLVFRVEAHDGKGVIGEGVHERFVIDNDKFLQKAQER